MGNLVTTWIVDILKSLFNWLVSISYWLALIGGGGSVVLYIGTQYNKFKRWAVVLVLLFLLLKGIETVI